MIITFLLAKMMRVLRLILIFFSITLEELFAYMAYYNTKVIKLVDIASLFNDVQFGYLYLSAPSQDIFSSADDLILGLLSDLEIPFSFCSARAERERKGRNHCFEE